MKKIINVPIAGKKELNNAVKTAQKAFKTFLNTDIRKRQALLKKIVEAIAANENKIASVLTLEQGKPLVFRFF